MTPNERSAKGAIYRAALEDGVVTETLDVIEAQFIKEWKNTFDASERDNCWRVVRIIQLLKSHMGAIVAGERDSISAIKRMK